MGNQSILDSEADACLPIISSKYSRILKTKKALSHSSPNHHSPHLKESYSTSDFTKETLGFNKTLDLASSEKIFKKTLGSSKPFSSSCLGPSSCSKSKAKAEKHHTCSFKTSFEYTDSSHSFMCSSKSRNRILTLTRLINGELFHVFHDPEF